MSRKFKLEFNNELSKSFANLLANINTPEKASGARRNRLVRKPRKLTRRQREVFSEAMGLFYDGVPVETLVNLIRMGVAK